MAKYLSPSKPLTACPGSTGLAYSFLLHSLPFPCWVVPMEPLDCQQRYSHQMLVSVLGAFTSFAFNTVLSHPYTHPRDSIMRILLDDEWLISLRPQEWLIARPPGAVVSFQRSGDNVLPRFWPLRAWC